MAKQDTYYRHRIIIQKLRSNPCTFEEIREKLKSESELNDMDLMISIRTFQRDIQEIYQLHNTEIKYDRSQKVYYIAEDFQDSYSERMFEALELFQVMNLNQSVAEFMQFKPRKAKGTEHLNGLLHSIQNKHQIQFRYMKFSSEEVDIRTVEPYLLKEFKDRWYVLAYDIEKKAFRTFGLDRMSLLNVLPHKFQFPQTIDPKVHYKDSFGIVGPNNGKAQDIILELKNNQGEYLRTLPLHDSQEILQTKGHKMQVKVHLIPTYDFIYELMSMGANLKVLKPKSLADELKRNFKNAYAQYENEE